MIILGLIIAVCAMGYYIGYCFGQKIAEEESDFGIYILLIIGAVPGVIAGEYSPWGSIMAFVYGPITMIVFYFTFLVGAASKNSTIAIKKEDMIKNTIAQYEIDEVNTSNNIKRYRVKVKKKISKNVLRENKRYKYDDSNSIKCPVCNKKVLPKDNYCSNCGFNELHYEFINEEDAIEWVETSVKPYKQKWLQKSSTKK